MMLTRCPACQTTFRLGPEQLRARQGEVRCGHCFHPFNALEHEIVPPSSTAHAARVTQDAYPAPSPASYRAWPHQATPEPEPPQAPHGSAAHGLAGPREAEPQEVAPQEADLQDGLPADDHPRGGLPQDTGFIVLEEKSAAAPAAEDPVLDDPHELPPPAPLPMPHGSDTTEEEATAEDVPPVLPEVLRSGRRAAADAAPDTRPSLSQPGQEDSFAGSHATGGSANIGAASDDAERPEAERPASSTPTSDTTGTTNTGTGEQDDTSLLRPAASQPAHRAAAREAPEAAHIDIEQLDAKYGRPKAPASLRQRALASLTVGLLGGLLAAQCVYLYRMEIARDLPGLRPLLETACAALKCTVPFPRDVELISVDLSDLQSEPGKPGQYILYATISNRAEYAQAWPHFELTLTDARDTPVARRVLAPHEWIPPAQHGDTFASRRAVNSRIAFAAPDLAPTGYRVGVFYP
ncbi:DUF3426 domain-containing protein [Thauera sp. SDU_THAU2]|uniref:DUF3426 domain-containing protein n=1 Tax=Thauera sp. SDU_THAU2 TaxID=3136633 RepID=UPI00311FA15C